MRKSPNRSLWQALSASVVAHAVLLASLPSQPLVHLILTGRRIDAQLVVPVATRPTADMVPASLDGAPVVPVPDVRQSMVSSDPGPRRKLRAAPIGGAARTLGTRLSGASSMQGTVTDASSAVSAEDLRQYRVDLAVAARRFNLYPPLALERGWQGTAEVVLEAAASLPAPRVLLLNSSGYDALDAQAVDMLVQAVRATPLPATLQARDFRVVVKVRFDQDDR